MWDVGAPSFTNEIFFLLETNGRLNVILSFWHPSVNCVDSPPQREPKKPLLEERGTACGGVVVRDTERRDTVSYE